jgi:hypothetical protein
VANQPTIPTNADRHELKLRQPLPSRGGHKPAARVVHRKIKVRVLSNVPSFRSDNAKSIENFYPALGKDGIARLLALIRVAFASYKYDVVFFNCATFDTIVTSTLLSLLPFNRCRIVTADLILRAPKTLWQTIAAFLKRLALKRVGLFMLYHKEFSGYSRFYGIDGTRVAYVPFKVNGLELIRQLKPSEGKYIFSGGASLRDWKILAEATEGLDIPLVIVAAKDSTASEKIFGGRATLIRDDGSLESWLRYMAESKFVVLPIVPDSIAASGISTYLSAMALRKCIIITEGPATRGILTDSISVIVPPNDPNALKEAIVRVDRDREFRERIAEAGYQYALSCGDTVRLHRDFVEQILWVARGQELQHQ